jgi:branched-chain amino acid transport system ATP-binding protein
MAPTSSDQAWPAETAADPAPVLQLRDVRVRLDSTVALNGVSFAVGPGQVVSVAGDDGAGKSTVFNAICGFVRPEAGEITWRGSPLRPRPHRLTTLGVARTLQGVGLYGGLTVLENVLVGSAGVPRVPAVPPGRPAGVAVALLGTLWPARDGNAVRVLAVDHLTRLGLAEYLDADLSAVPVPLQGRVVLARALLAEPELLLLDDPAVGLDSAVGPGGSEGLPDADPAASFEPAAIAELAALVRALPVRSAGSGRSSAVLLGTRVPELALAASDRVVVLDRGSVVAAGTPSELRAAVSHHR